MALITKIRKNFILIIILIGLGLGGFIIMDMTSGQQSAFGGPNTTLGSIEGEKISYNDFMRTDQVREQMVFRGSDPFFRRELLWNFTVEKVLVEQEAEALGLGVSKTELLDLQFGPNPSPIIQQYYRNPRTGQLDRNQLNQIKQAIESNQFSNPQFRAFWAQQEKEVIKERLQSKLGFMAAKGIYTPTWMAELGNTAQNQRMELEFVAVPFDELDNSEVTLTDDDLKAFIQDNKARFTNKEETRRVAYATFNVTPTASDSASWKKVIADLIPEFEETTEDSLFVQARFGRMDPAYLKKDQVSPSLADTVFSVPVGTVIGPYVEGRFYQAVKVVDRKVLPDSVRSRHILLRATTQEEANAAFSTIDSLKQVLESGTGTWDSLALAFGTDGTRTNGGDLGYAAPNQMVKPFNDLIFFQGEVGKLYVLPTEFGLHLVEITDRKYIDNEEGVKLAFLEQSILPSEDTQKERYEAAYEFLGGNQTIADLRAATDSRNITLETSPALKKNDFNIGTLGSGQSSRDIIKWAFESGDPGDVSPEIYSFREPTENYTNKYVVVALESVQDPGLAKLENIRQDIEPEVINQKKAALLTSRMEGKSPEAIASEFSIEVDSISGVTFNTSTIPGLGYEPNLVAAAFGLAPGAESEPIVGTSAVFKIRMVEKPEVGILGNIPQLRRSLSSSPRQMAQTQLISGLKDKASIKDNRSDFF